MKNLVIAVIMLAAVAVMNGYAEPNPTMSNELISERLASGDPVKIKEGVEGIRGKMRSDNPKDMMFAMNPLRGSWLKSMMAAKLYDDVEKISQELILTSPSLDFTEPLLQYRIRALQAMGKHDEALAASKSLFNVCRMSSTASTLLLIVECLRAKNPDNEAIIEKFRAEQEAGAATPAAGTNPAALASAATSSGAVTVLGSIKIDPAPYTAALRLLTGEDFTGLTARGNLLLLADRVKDARTVFERAYSISGDKQLVAASENIARCMRAEDGTIGRANAWVVSIRPK